MRQKNQCARANSSIVSYKHIHKHTRTYIANYAKAKKNPHKSWKIKKNFSLENTGLLKNKLVKIRLKNTSLVRTIFSSARGFEKNFWHELEKYATHTHTHTHIYIYLHIKCCKNTHANVYPFVKSMKNFWKRDTHMYIYSLVKHWIFFVLFLHLEKFY